MPSPRHDALKELFDDRPQLAVEILRDLMGVELPATPLIRVEDNTFNTRTSDDIKPDLVIVLGPPQTPAHAIIVEIQQDKSKNPRQLARYAAAAWLMLGCNVTVLVICPDRAAADYYAQPIDSGLDGYRLQARVLGPDDIPAIVDAEQALAHLDLAAMSVMVHGRDRKVIEAFATALAKTDIDHAVQYHEHATSMASPEIRRLMEEIMKTKAWPVHSSLAREHFGRGKAEGRAEGRTEGAARMVLAVLTARGIDIPDDIRTRITTCTDLAQLETWAIRAATTPTIEDLFVEASGEHR